MLKKIKEILGVALIAAMVLTILFFVSFKIFAIAFLAIATFFAGMLFGPAATLWVGKQIARGLGWIYTPPTPPAATS